MNDALPLRPEDGQDTQPVRSSLDAAYDRIREHADAIVGLVAWRREATDRLAALEAGQRTSESAQARLEGAIEGIRAAQDALRTALADISSTTHATHDQLTRHIGNWSALIETHIASDAAARDTRSKLLHRIAWPLGVIAAALTGAVTAWKNL